MIFEKSMCFTTSEEPVPNLCDKIVCRFLSKTHQVLHFYLYNVAID